MTREEAIIDIKENIKPAVGGKSLEIAIADMEKQIPKKLIVANVRRYTLYGCPTCDYSDTLWSLKKKDKYCPNCGQALDWWNEDAE